MAGSMELCKVAGRMAVGAECAAGGVHFRVWAPRARQVELQLLDAANQPQSSMLLEVESGDGYFSRLLPDVAEGSLYGFRLDGSAWRMAGKSG